jgi:hypothetical protein
MQVKTQINCASMIFILGGSKHMKHYWIFSWEINIGLLFYLTFIWSSFKMGVYSKDSSTDKKGNLVGV